MTIAKQIAVALGVGNDHFIMGGDRPFSFAVTVIGDSD